MMGAGAAVLSIAGVVTTTVSRLARISLMDTRSPAQGSNGQTTGIGVLDDGATEMEVVSGGGVVEGSGKQRGSSVRGGREAARVSGRWYCSREQYPLVNSRWVGQEKFRLILGWDLSHLSSDFTSKHTQAPPSSDATRRRTTVPDGTTTSETQLADKQRNDPHEQETTNEKRGPPMHPWKRTTLYAAAVRPIKTRRSLLQKGSLGELEVSSTKLPGKTAAHASVAIVGSDPQKSVPSISVIGLNGIMLWNHEGHISSENLKENIMKAWAALHLQVGLRRPPLINFVLLRRRHLTAPASSSSPTVRHGVASSVLGNACMLLVHVGLRRFVVATIDREAPPSTSPSLSLHRPPMTPAVYRALLRHARGLLLCRLLRQQRHCLPLSSLFHLHAVDSVVVRLSHMIFFSCSSLTSSTAVAIHWCCRGSPSCASWLFFLCVVALSLPQLKEPRCVAMTTSLLSSNATSSPASPSRPLLLRPLRQPQAASTPCRSSAHRNRRRGLLC
ncbi:hypothetical protein U9M48_027839 [Paspalum notatum var. saurae]|uniref:Uncharacterized protein n=1 Tax=Paspalum notatum var. saurae TaxID=547442 RepID=A0AAQ3U083_PASNO